MAKDLDPTFECNERKVGPEHGDRTIEKKRNEPWVVSTGLRNANVSPTEDVEGRYR